MMKLIVIVMLLFVPMASIAQSPATQPSVFGSALTASESDSLVTLTRAEAEGLIKLIDDMELQIDLLQADLKDCQADLPGTESWVMRGLKSPALWFCAGVVAGTVLAH